ARPAGGPGGLARRAAAGPARRQRRRARRRDRDGPAAQRARAAQARADRGEARLPPVGGRRRRRALPVSPSTCPVRGEPNLLLVAHGTRDPAGAVVTERVAARAERLLGVPVRACFADVRGPTPVEALAELPGPTVAVPAFLAAGYHVRA